MTEEHAKNILNGLARKVGARRMYAGPLSTVCLDFNKDGCHLVYSVQKDGLCTMLFNEASCRKLLEKMLEVSAQGTKHVFCTSLAHDNDVFLPAYSTLESVLISLDLEGK